MKKTLSLIAGVFLMLGLTAQTSVTIYQIQGQSAASPYEGQTVTTSGIVTAISSYGFYIQDGSGAWNGIFVYTSDYSPAMGDDVTLTAVVNEYYDLTELKDISAFNVTSSGNPLPEPSVLDAAQASSEDYEGVLVKVENLTVTAEPDQYGIWTCEDQSGNTLRVDDDMYAYSPSVGDELTVTGIMVYSYSEYKLNPRFADDIQGGGAPPSTVTIYDIQGQAAASPFEGQIVTTSGIVTATSDYGYYIQDGVGAWNGIFVFDNQNTPQMGDELQIKGEVSEYYDFTEIKNVSSYTVVSSGNNLPEPANITAAQASTEDFESVLVVVKYVTVTEGPDQYGIWTCEDENGDQLRVDDDMYAYTPTIGDKLDITGIMAYSYQEYKLNPRNEGDIAQSSGVEDFMSVNLSIFPNPVPDMLKVNSDKNFNTIKIFDVEGRLVYFKDNINKNEYFVDLSDLPENIYFLNVIFNDGSNGVKKFIKK